MGYQALASEDAHGNNVAVGYQTLKTQDAGADGFNTAVGYQAGTAITTGTDNTFVGSNAGDALIDSDHNVAIGHQALTADTKGSKSTAVGAFSLNAQNFTSAADSYNTAIGYVAGGAVTTGVRNTLIGGLTGDALTEGEDNTYIGYNAGGSDDLGNYNVGIGSGALSSLNYTGETNGFNTAVGYNALNDCTTAVQNTTMGNEAGGSVTTGSYNICIGNAAANHDNPLTTGGSNIIIGAYADTSAQAGASQLVLGYNVTSAGDNNFTFGNTSTDSNIAHGATSISAPSDERLKEDIKDETVGLAFINELRPVTFQWKKEKDVPSDMGAYVKDSDKRVMNGKYNHGFIAQEVKAVIDKHDIKDGLGLWMESGKDKRQRLAEGELIPFLVKAIQELSAEVKALKGE